MLIEVYAVLVRAKPGRDYVVLIRAFPQESGPNPVRHLDRTAHATTLEEAEELRTALSHEVREAVERLGHTATIVNIG
jgi:hypothetical protein